MKLAVLICSIPGREGMLDKLNEYLHIQAAELGLGIENFINWANFRTDITIGQKRQDLLNTISADYVCFHDDDDPLQSGYLQEIWKAIQSGPDVVGFRGFMTTNGSKRVNFRIDKGVPYAAVGGEYLRHHNHLCPVKREIALQIGYKDMQYGEDHDYAVRLKDSGLIKTHAFIDKEIYHYDFRTHKTSAH